MPVSSLRRPSLVWRSGRFSGSLSRVSTPSIHFEDAGHPSAIWGDGKRTRGKAISQCMRSIAQVGLGGDLRRQIPTQPTWYSRSCAATAARVPSPQMARGLRPPGSMDGVELLGGQPDLQTREVAGSARRDWICSSAPRPPSCSAIATQRWPGEPSAARGWSTCGYRAPHVQPREIRYMCRRPALLSAGPRRL